MHRLSRLVTRFARFHQISRKSHHFYKLYASSSDNVVVDGNSSSSDDDDDHHDDPVRAALREFLENPEEAAKQVRAKSKELAPVRFAPPENAEKLPSVLPLVTKRSFPVYPSRETFLEVSDSLTIAMLDSLIHKQLGIVGLFKAKDAEVETLTPPAAVSIESQPFESLDDVQPVGMLHWIIPTGKKGFYRMIPLHRITATKFQAKPSPIVSVNHFPNSMSGNYSEDEKTMILGLLMDIKKLFEEFMDPKFAQYYGQLNVQFEQAGMVADIIATAANFWSSELQSIMNEIDVSKRLKLISDLLRRQVIAKKTREQLAKDAQMNLEEQAKKHMKRQMLETLKKELGLVKDDREELVRKFKDRLEGKELPERAKKVIEEELEKLGILEPSSSEFSVTRNYLDWLTQIPWGVHSKENLDIERALAILNEDHYGLQEIKDRILEFIAVGNLMGAAPKGRILCFLGPPGVGKTSIGRSIARALDRKFFRFSVGGMSDVAEIKGHRRTYVGAMPGKLIQCLKSVQSSNPVILIDEIDKISRSYQGDPASALLEVLDPEQNATFVDHYLDVPVDLSKVLFICTANEEDTIRGPLADRMEFIRLSGYITNEKLEIAKSYLIPQAKKSCGIKDGSAIVSESAVTALIKSYCREAGVRSLEKEIEKIFRKAALKLVRKESDKIEVTAENLDDFVGKPRYANDRLYSKTPEGVVCGLAWTAMGGSTLFIETVIDELASKSGESKGSLRCTGRLGDTMKESSEIAYTVAKRYMHLLFPENEFLQTKAIHLHVPAGAIAKDGPSAGITMVSALISLASGIPVLDDVAMTGELSLTGKVLPIGGVREKAVAAKRAGIRVLIFPKENKGDFDELPDFVKEGFEVHFVDYFDDVIRIIFRNNLEALNLSKLRDAAE